MSSLLRQQIERVGMLTAKGIEEAGYMSRMFYETFEWLLLGNYRNQPVRLTSIFRESMSIGIQAIPIISILCFSIGLMLAIQGIATLKPFGVEARVVDGIAISVTREFSPLIVGILIAGRSGSAIAARIGTMLESQEIDALRVIGINPVRYLVAPIMLAMIICLPCLVILGDTVQLLGGALYTKFALYMPLSVYFDRTFDVLSVGDVMQGLIKSIAFAVAIGLVGLTNGFQVQGGAEGVGRATTRSVVTAISLIVIADMIFTYYMNR